MKTWVKLYTELNDDPKMRPFTWAQKGIWSALLILAGKNDIRSGDGSETGELYSIEDTAWAIRCDLGEFTEAVALFSRPIGENEKAMLYEQDGVLFITNYARRQARPPSQQREAVRQRVANHRARKRNEDVTRASQPVTPSKSDTESDSDSDTDTESESDSDAERDTPTSPGLQHIRRYLYTPPSDSDLRSIPSDQSDQTDHNNRAPPPPPGFTTFTQAKQEELVVRHLANAQQRPLDDDQLNTIHRTMLKERPALTLEMAQRTDNGKPKENAVGYWIQCLKQPRGP